MEYTPKVNCPYCGREWEITIDDKTHKQIVVRCSNPFGGCGKHFAVFSEIKISVDVKRIEGEQTP